MPELDIETVTYLIGGLLGLLMVYGIVATIRTYVKKAEANRFLKALTENVHPLIEPCRAAAETLLNQLQVLTTFAAVADWDSRATTAIQRIRTTLTGIGQRLTVAQSNINLVAADKVSRRWRDLELKTLTASKSALEQLEDALQEKIDFTPNDKDEQKALVAELMDQKRELQFRKKEINAQIRDIRREARVRSVTAPARISAQFVGIGRERRMIAYQREAHLRPDEDEKAATDRQLIDLDRPLAWAKTFTQ